MNSECEIIDRFRGKKGDIKHATLRMQAEVKNQAIFLERIIYLFYPRRGRQFRITHSEFRIKCTYSGVRAISALKARTRQKQPTAAVIS